MSSGNQYERLFKLWATVAKLVVDGKRSAERVSSILQDIVDEARIDAALRSFELYLHPSQKDRGWIGGFELDAHLKETGLIDRCLSLEDDRVKQWLEDPSTYPEEYKIVVVFLWKSQEDSGGRRSVAHLRWCDGRVLVLRSWLDRRWLGFSSVLLTRS